MCTLQSPNENPNKIKTQIKIKAMELTEGSPPVGSPPAGRVIGVGCIANQGGRQRRGPGRGDPWHRGLVLGVWYITSLARKEPELVLRF